MKTSSQTGYVDAHVHITDASGLDAVVAAGVAAVRDAGSKNGAGLPAGSAEQGRRPAILSAGWAIFHRGGYGSLFGVPVETRDDIRSEIIGLSRARAGIIKVMASGIVSLSKPGEITAGGFPPDDLAFIVREARAQGLGVMAHANGERAILAAADAGVRSIEHGFFMTERALSVLADRKIFWVPTAGALKRASETAGASEKARTFVAGLIRSHLDMTGRAWSMGVPLAIGTDCVLPDPRYREAYQQEIEYFEKAGIPHDEVLRIACEGGAKLLGIKT
jgi:imidazolonepropionase-like amidohydrolase